MKSHSMIVLDAIWSNETYQVQYQRLLKAEEQRLFCCHDITHLLDTARIAYIMNLEQNLGFRKDVIYATAIMHDIGKAEQYESGAPHEIVGAELADEILAQINGERTANGLEPYFTANEVQAICRAIREHRRCPEGSSILGQLLYRADKASRPCFACDQRDGCSWSDEKKNLTIKQ